jgi:hypothetical protein
MRRYLAQQAMESGKSLGRDFMGRTGALGAYGSGMLINSDSSSSKVGEFECFRWLKMKEEV